MWAIPFTCRSRGSSLVTSSPATEIVPLAAARKPVIASTNSVCPFPCTPAIPTISPARTTKETPSTTARPSGSTTWRLSTDNITSPGSRLALSAINCTGLPTIISAICASEVAFGSTSPTTLPRRNTLIRSAMVSASFNLWVMNTTPRPAAINVRTMAKNSMISLGVRTAVGSSKTTTLASRSKTFTISTRCCTPTGISSITASGSSSRL